MHGPDQRIRGRSIFPIAQARKPEIERAVGGAQNFEPQPGVISDRQVLNDILTELRNISGANLGGAPVPELAGQGDPISGEIDVSSVLTNSAVPVPPTRRINFYDVPSGLGTFDIRINEPTARVFDGLRVGNDFEWPTPIRRIFVTTAPAIASGRIRFFVGNARVRRDATSRATGPSAVHFGHLQHTMAAAIPLDFTWPLVPVGIRHVFEHLSFTSTVAGQVVFASINTGGIERVPVSNFISSIAGRDTPLIQSSDDEELYNNELTVWGGERLIVRFTQDFNIGDTANLDYRYRVEPGAQIHTVDPQVVAETEG